MEEAEQMYERTLAGFEKALGPDYMLTLRTVKNLLRTGRPWHTGRLL
jgi:hypothetical protein